jgi:hypothetical protein
MPVDCHLFANLQEGVSKNVALTFHIKEGNKDDQDPDPDSYIKYSFAMPRKFLIHSNGHSSQDVVQRNVSRKTYSVCMMRFFNVLSMHRAYILKTPPRKLSGMASTARQRSIIDERHLQLTLSHLKASIICW